MVTTRSQPTFSTVPDEFEVLPELLEEAVVVPLVVRRDGDAVRDVADNVQLLNGDLKGRDSVDISNLGCKSGTNSVLEHYQVFESLEDKAAQKQKPAPACPTAQSRS